MQVVKEEKYMRISGLGRRAMEWEGPGRARRKMNG